jgi:hypothetical protein
LAPCRFTRQEPEFPLRRNKPAGSEEQNKPAGSEEQNKPAGSEEGAKKVTAAKAGGTLRVETWRFVDDHGIQCCD